MTDDDAITRIKGIGPALAGQFAAVGITTARHLRDLGTDAAYGMLLRSGKRPHFIMYYALEMALQGRPWNDCKGAEKDALRVRFDRLKARDTDPDRAAFEAAMDALGVIDPAAR